MRAITRFKESTRLTRGNAGDFLRHFAKDIALEDLECISGQYGDSVLFNYGPDKLLKVPKNGHRTAFHKELELVEYLHTQQVPVAIPQPLQVHPRGLYAVYPRENSPALSPETVVAFTAAELESCARSLGAFFSFLHTHPFPDQVLQYIPRADDPYPTQLKWVKRKIEFVKEHSTQFDTARWEAQLAHLQGSLDQAGWAVTHCDPSLGHFFAVDGDPGQLAVIGFIDAHQHDPAVDLAEFAIEMHSDLPALLAGQLVELVIKHYRTDDRGLADKIEFGLLEFAIRRAFQGVRRSLREAHRAGGD